MDLFRFVVAFFACVRTTLAGPTDDGAAAAAAVVAREEWLPPTLRTAMAHWGVTFALEVLSHALDASLVPSLLSELKGTSASESYFSRSPRGGLTGARVLPCCRAQPRLPTARLRVSGSARSATPRRGCRKN